MKEKLIMLSGFVSHRVKVKLRVMVMFSDLGFCTWVINSLLTLFLLRNIILF
jgi:hypothetical protein